jgi:hypothetical protein
MGSPFFFCVCMNIPFIGARRRLGKHVPAATDTQQYKNWTRRFLCSVCRIKGNFVCLCIPLNVVRQRLGKYFPVATNTQA